MAQPICSFCESEHGILMVTDIIDGDTKVVGASCLPGYALAMTATVTTGMQPELAKAYGEYFDAIARNDSRPKSRRAAGKSSGRPTQTSTEHATDAESGTSGQEDSPVPNGSDTPDDSSQTQHSASGDYDDMHQADESDTG